jgi:hypothetical protein
LEYSPFELDALSPKGMGADKAGDFSGWNNLITVVTSL